MEYHYFVEQITSFGKEECSFILRQMELVYGNRFLLDIGSSQKSEKTTQKEENTNNSMNMESILEGLINIQNKKIGKCISAKELWLRLKKSTPMKNKKQRYGINA